MSDLQAFWEGLDWFVPIKVLISIIPALICITVHELCHGLAAYALGDTTAKSQGRLTLNPIRHIDIIGLMMMIVMRFGWAKPVPVNMLNFKKPKRGMAITALAGPLSNIILATFMMLLLGLIAHIPAMNTTAGYYVLETIDTTADLSVALAVFNILPVPPLDGSKVLFSLIPDESYFWLMRYERYGMIVLILLIWSGILARPLSVATGFIYGGIAQIALLMSNLTHGLFS